MQCDLSVSFGNVVVRGCVSRGTGRDGQHRCTALSVGKVNSVESWFASPSETDGAGQWSRERRKREAWMASNE